MHVLPFFATGGDQPFKQIYEILLQVFQTVVGSIERALLDCDGTGGMMRVNETEAVLDTGRGDCIPNMVGDLYESRISTFGLYIYCFSVNFHEIFPFLLRSSHAWRMFEIISSTME